MRYALLLPGLVTAVTPVEKVIQMMTGMLAKGKADKAEESKIFDEYSAWVHDQDRDTKLDIGNAKSQIEKLEATKAKADATVDSLTNELSDLYAALAGFQTELSDATSQREEENAEYQKVSADYGESVDALDRAIQVMKRREGKIEAISFLQNLAKTVPRASSELLAFLQQPQAKQYSYEFQSGGIVELLKKLKKKFSGQLNDVVTAEQNSAHNYELMKMNLEDEIENSQSSIDTKTTEKAEQEGVSADA